jgi:hypothetical protein
MTAKGLDSFAIEDPETPNRFLAALLIPNVQLLVVAAEYPAPEDLKAHLDLKNYRDVYIALHQPASASTRFFLMDLDLDGIQSKGEAVDILYDGTESHTFFNGDWRGQGLSEAEYKSRLEGAERRYSRVLEHLSAALASAPSGS